MSFAVLAIVLSVSPIPPWNQFGAGQGFNVGNPRGGASPEWKRAIGPGRGGIVTDGESLFITFAKPKPDSKGKAGDEVIACLDMTTGKTKWEESVAVEMLPTQQFFGGAPIQPQATPCVFNKIIYTVGFTGLLHARDTATGKLIWQKDLVADFGAKPVQFGFAASPFFCSGKVFVHTGGRHALVALNAADGQTIWTAEAAGASYATPIVYPVFKTIMIVQMTQNAVFGFDIANGKTMWKYDLPKKGLTNVPMPLWLYKSDTSELIISGQGCDGTRLLDITEADGQFIVKERWHQKKVQFFYSTFARNHDTVFGFSGNTGSRFAAVNVQDGSVITQELGQREANCVIIGETLLLLRGDGVLTRCHLTKDGFENVLGAKPLSGRCWAPPMVHQGSVFIRSDTEIASVAMSSLKADFKLPPDSGRTAMDEAFGGSGKK